MDRGELFNAVTYTPVALSGTTRSDHGLSLPRDRRPIVFGGKCLSKLGENWQIGPHDKKELEKHCFIRFFPTATVRYWCLSANNSKKLLKRFGEAIGLPLALALGPHVSILTRLCKKKGLRRSSGTSPGPLQVASGGPPEAFRGPYG